jgi:hypothetical protein
MLRNGPGDEMKRFMQADNMDVSSFLEARLVFKEKNILLETGM